MELFVDADRLAEWDNDKLPKTGIYVRAKYGPKWSAYDISVLRADCLQHWLRSRGEKNTWAENTVGVLLGYGPLTATDLAPLRTEDHAP